MRRSKIKRQEDRREKQRTNVRRVKEAAPKQASAWTVVHQDDVSNMKYRPNWKPDWFDEGHARALAEPAHPDHRWIAVNVDDLSQFGGPGVTHKELLARKAANADV